jgi:hypothetical protein
MTVQFKRFAGAMTRVDDLCTQAAEFASTVGMDRLIGITQSSEGVTVWYWAA